MGVTRKRRGASSDYDEDKTERRKKQKRDYATRRREQDKKILVRLDTENRELTRQSSQQRQQIGQLKMWANYAKSYLNLLVAFKYQPVRGSPAVAQGQTRAADQGLYCPDRELFSTPRDGSDGVCSPVRTVSEGFCSPGRSSEDGCSSLNDAEEELSAVLNVSTYPSTADLPFCLDGLQESELPFGNIVEPVDKGEDGMSCHMDNIERTHYQDFLSFDVTEECVTHAQWVHDSADSTAAPPASRKWSLECADSEGSISNQSWSFG